MKAAIDFRYATPFATTATCNVAPMQGTLGIPGAVILFPGDPTRSLINIRMKGTGGSRMPPLASSIVHADGVALLDAWVSSLTTCP